MQNKAEISEGVQRKTKKSQYNKNKLLMKKKPGKVNKSQLFNENKLQMTTANNQV